MNASPPQASSSQKPSSSNLLLPEHRAAIDVIDMQMLDLLNQRARHAQAIGALKGEGPKYRPEREAEVLTRLRACNAAGQGGGPLPDEAVERIFREVMSACLALEHPLTIAYLGPSGSFSQAAVQRHFGHATCELACSSLAEVFQRVEAREADYLVAPVENSTGGAVGLTLDLMADTSLTLCGEVQLRIRQNLLRRCNHAQGIIRIYSHAQSLAQCQNWLDRNHPQAERIAVASNSEAARLASETQDCAAIASEMAAREFHLHLLASGIEDQPNNTTRFAVLGYHPTVPTGRDRTSLVVSAPHRPGAVYRLLEPLARHRVSMTRFESRPARQGLWEYLFFIDLEGHAQDPPVAQALEAMREHVAFFKNLGSYPRVSTGG